MQVAMFGAAGRAGRHVLQRLRADGHALRLLLREPDRGGLASGCAVTVGDARDPQRVVEVIRGADAVVSCLGIQDFSRPSTDLSDAMRVVCDVMKANGVGRIMAIAAIGTLDGPGGGLRSEAPGYPAMLKFVAEEHARMFRLLAGSGLTWTLLCPALLRADLPDGYRAEIDGWPEGGQATGFQHLADAFATGLARTEWFGRRIGLAA